MAAVISILVVAAVAMVIVRIGATALEMTGLSRDAANFQAVSAFFGAGFTTGESELVVNHPVRRRVVRDLIILGQIGVTTILVVAVNALFDFRGLTTAQSWEHAGVAVGGVVLLWLVARSELVRRAIDVSIRRTFKRAGAVHVRDYERLLGVHKGCSIDELHIRSGHWLADRTLAQAALRKDGVVVLAVTRANGEFIGAPHGDTQILPGDALLLYGMDEAVKRIAQRQHA